MMSRRSEPRRHVILTNRKDNRSLRYRPSSQQGTSSTAGNNFDAGSRYVQALKILSARDQLEASVVVVAEEDGDDTEQPETSLSDVVVPKPSRSIEPSIQGVSQRHMSLTYTYMGELASITFNFPKTAVYNPAITMSRLCLQCSDAGTQWTAILAEEMICRLSGQYRSKEMALQRTAGCRALKSALNNHHIDFQAAYVALLKAAQVSCWFGDVKTQNTYGLAADMLIQSVGGVERALVLTPDMESFYIAGPFYFARFSFFKCKALQKSSVRFLQAIQRILRFNRPRIKQQRPFRARIEDLMEGRPVSNDYTKLEAEAMQYFKPFTIPVADLPDASLKYRLLLLFELCWIFVAHDPDSVIKMLRKILHIVHTSLLPPQDTNQQDLQAICLATMISYVRGEILTGESSAVRLKSDVAISTIKIDGLQIFDYLAPSYWELITAKLHAWFQDLDDQSEPFTAMETETLLSTVTSKWAARHQTIA